MPSAQKFLRISVKVFKILAFVVLGLQTIAGLILLITGGDPVFVGGIELPARMVGALNFIAAGVYFFSLWLMSSLIQIVLEIRERVEKSA